MKYDEYQIEAEASWCENWQKGEDAARMIRSLWEENKAMQSRLESLEKDCEELIKERDEREDVINELLNQVLLDERKEWSSVYDFADAVIDVECKMKSLEKDAARYRWVASQKSIWQVLDDRYHLPDVETFDEAIDTAMQANKGE